MKKTTKLLLLIGLVMFLEDSLPSIVMNSARVEQQNHTAQCASLIDVYGLLPFCKQTVLMVLRCNCFRISGFLLGSALPEP